MCFFLLEAHYGQSFLSLLVSSNIKYQFENNKNQNIHQVEKYNDFINLSLNINNLPGRINYSS